MGSNSSVAVRVCEQRSKFRAGRMSFTVFVCSCHSIQDSLLSSNSSFTGYRGVLNWTIILLVGLQPLLMVSLSY